jgi:glycosyltransferase involved in cell wall biosynthesis
MKNLRMAIELVGDLAGEVSLDIYGPVDDESYGRECQAATARVRSNVKVTWHGNVNPAEVSATFANYEFFILPTLGENFGHVILESLGAGCPVLLSDRTPWRRLEVDGAGWTLPIEIRERWMEVLRSCVEMDESSHNAMRQRARIVSQSYSDRESAIQQNIALFEEVLKPPSPTRKKP